jgi:hypothetical protein
MLYVWNQGQDPAHGPAFIRAANLIRLELPLKISG